MLNEAHALVFLIIYSLKSYPTSSRNNALPGMLSPASLRLPLCRISRNCSIVILSPAYVDKRARHGSHHVSQETVGGDLRNTRWSGEVLHPSGQLLHGRWWSCCRHQPCRRQHSLRDAENAAPPRSSSRNSGDSSSASE